MEEQNGIVDPTAAVAAPNPHTNRRTAAIDVLTRALLSPPSISIPIQGKDSEDANRDESTTATKAEEAASNAVAAAASAARSFLDTTSSVYVLGADTTTSIAINTSATSPNNAAGGQSNNNNNNSMPKIFGCWNFLHQAMNEIERFEDEQNHAASTAAATSTNNSIDNITPPSLLSETRLLAEFAVKVARRSDDLDRQKVATCVENFCGSTTPNNAAAASASASGKENAITDSTSSRGNASSNDTNGRIPKGRLVANDKTDGTSTGTSNSTTSPTADSNSTNANRNSGRHDIHVLLPHLVRANAEIREIVTGRIAAFSLQPPSPLSMPSSLSNSTNISKTTAFADPLVVETFCRFLAANAVSNGAERLRRFLNDWIIPGATADDNSVSPSNAGAASATTSTSPLGGKRQRLSPGGRNKRLLHHRLPPYSLACVLYHVATEAEMIPPSTSSEDDEDDDDGSASASASSTVTARTISPLGTIDVLQQLSLPVMANVLLGPVLHDALQSKQLKRQLKQHREHLQQQQQQQQQQQPASSPPPEVDESGDDMDDRTIAMGLRAILKWCTATDLSLAQTKHIGSKVQVGEKKPQQ